METKKALKIRHLSDLEESSKLNGFFETSKSMKNNNFEDTVFRMNLTHKQKK